jgi:hypothetical protein
MTGQQDQLKAVIDLVDAIFNGDAGHWMPLSCEGFDGKQARSLTRMPEKHKPCP